MGETQHDCALMVLVHNEDCLACAYIRQSKEISARPTSMTQTETPRKVTTIAEAVKVFNETRWRGRENWTEQGLADFYVNATEVLAIATALTGYIHALETELESLRQERDTLRETLEWEVARLEKEGYPPSHLGGPTLTKLRAVLAQQPEVK